MFQGHSSVSDTPHPPVSSHHSTPRTPRTDPVSAAGHNALAVLLPVHGGGRVGGHLAREDGGGALVHVRRLGAPHELRRKAVLLVLLIICNTARHACLTIQLKQSVDPKRRNLGPVLTECGSMFDVACEHSYLLLFVQEMHGAFCNVLGILCEQDLTHLTQGEPTHKGGHLKPFCMHVRKFWTCLSSFTFLCGDTKL